MAWTRRFEEAEPQRINKWLGQSGVCSRREAEGLIERGLVSIDGEVVKDAGRKIQPGQTLVLADGEGAAPLSVVPRHLATQHKGQLVGKNLVISQSLARNCCAWIGMSLRKRSSPSRPIFAGQQGWLDPFGEFGCPLESGQ